MCWSPKPISSRGVTIGGGGGEGDLDLMGFGGCGLRGGIVGIGVDVQAAGWNTLLKTRRKPRISSALGGGRK